MGLSIENFILFCDSYDYDSVMESLIDDIKNESEDLWENYSSNLNKLIKNIEKDTEPSLEHALGKHANIHTTNAHDDHKKPISYFDSRKDLLKFCSNLIRRENLLFYNKVFNHRSKMIVIEGQSSMRIGTVRQRDLEIGTMYVRVIIGVKYESLHAIEELKLHSVYPIPYIGYKSFDEDVNFKKAMRFNKHINAKVRQIY